MHATDIYPQSHHHSKPSASYPDNDKPSRLCLVYLNLKLERRPLSDIHPKV